LTTAQTGGQTGARRKRVLLVPCGLFWQAAQSRRGQIMSIIKSIAAASIIMAAPAASYAMEPAVSFHQFLVASSAHAALEAGGAAKRLSVAGAQPDYMLNPAYGSVSLRAGFTPDPHVTDILAGGELPAQDALSGYNIGSAGDRRCRGNIAEAPDLRLHFDATGSLPLFIRAVADFDTTLVVNGPDGTWYCDDDSGEGLQAELRWDNPQTGQYDIWVGAYFSGSNYEPARIEISELARRGSRSGGGSAGLDFTLAPRYGSVTLTSGFAPDPHSVRVSARSELSVSSALSSARIEDTGDGRCRGHTGAAPDLSVTYSAGSYFPLIVRAIADFDTTLVVNAPDGSWHCDDDSGAGLDSELTFRDPLSGRYDIWFGAFSSSRDGQRGRLEISELGRAAPK